MDAVGEGVEWSIYVVQGTQWPCCFEPALLAQVDMKAKQVTRIKK